MDNRDLLILLFLATFLCVTVFAGPSGHAQYSWAYGTSEFDEISYDVRWNSMPPGHSAYASMQFWFSNDVGGYMGTQFHADGTQLLDFAIWDGAGRPGSSHPGSPWCTRFGHEGDGSHCEKGVSLSVGQTYQLRLFKTAQSAQGSTWTSTINGMSIGSLFFDEQSAGALGRLKPQAVGFLEYFMDQSASFDASVGFQGPYGLSNGEQQTASSAVCDCDENTGCESCAPGFGCGRPNVLLKGGPNVPTGSGPIWQGVVQEDTMQLSNTTASNLRQPRLVDYHPGLVQPLADASAPALPLVHVKNCLGYTYYKSRSCPSFGTAAQKVEYCLDGLKMGPVQNPQINACIQDTQESDGDFKHYCGYCNFGNHSMSSTAIA